MAGIAGKARTGAPDGRYKELQAAKGARLPVLYEAVAISAGMPMVDTG